MALTPVQRCPDQTQPPSHENENFYSTAGIPALNYSICVIQMTERKRAEEESQLLQTLTQAISEASDFHTTFGRTFASV